MTVSMPASRKTMLKLLTILVAVPTFMITTIPPAKGVTLDEELAFIDCQYPLSLSSQKMYSCDRIALYMKGECGVGGSEKDLSDCKKVTEYIINNGLQNEQPLSHEEVAEDFRILIRPEIEEEKSDVEKSMDELVDIYRNAPPEESEPKPPGGGLFD
jgi:hypothetical protein